MSAFEDFLHRVGDAFTVETTAGAVPLRLTECVVIGPNRNTNSFGLTFSGSGAPLEQDTYLLSAEGFEPEPMFLVPVGPSTDGADYQAVFNRLPD